MKKVAIVFVLAVLVPSLVLAWLAVRSLRDQQFVLERQQSLLYQNVADSLARDIDVLLAERQREFAAHVETILSERRDGDPAADFDDLLRARWPLADVGFLVSGGGQLLSPTPGSRSEARAFLVDNAAFLGNRQSVEVFWNSFLEERINPRFSQRVSQNLNTTPPMPLQEGNLYPGKAQQRRINPEQQQVLPHQQGDPLAQSDGELDQQLASRLNTIDTEFQFLNRIAPDGMVARFVQNRLQLLFWHRDAAAPEPVYGAQINLARLIQDLRPLIRLEPAWRDEICLALLDENAKPLALTETGFTAAWKRPFVAAEIGEALPHWEVAVYLRNPARLTQAARTTQWTLGLLIALLVIAIAIGSWLIARDLNRELALARQKTDFVSNVSHELKTPLTSIRMFSELLAEGRVADAAKQRSYLNIITAEAARLTRLINNVLDFARIERGEKKYGFRDCDLVTVARDTAESYRPHLENNGFRLACALPDTPLPVRGDPDALAQVIVNLLSNAEKYSNDSRDLVLEAARCDGPLPCAEIRVLDRGAGVPRGCEEKIFEQFYRAHDSLNSGVQGSGLGLTLARQIARAHGGDVCHERRVGGGSCFALRLPLTQS